MKQLTIILFSLFCSTACAQQNKEIIHSYEIEKYINEESKYINKDNFVSEINKHIKHYPIEPIFYLRVTKKNCLIEIDINDIPFHNDYELSNYITPLKISGKILKSGTQTVTVRMYPVENLINESLGKEGPSIDSLLPNSSLSISVIQIDNRSEKKLQDELLVTQNLSPSKDDKFVGSGLPYYEYSFTFEAEVPYDLEGWTQGQDLRKLDQKKLEQKALEFYKMVQQIYVNKDLDSWLKLEYDAILRTYSSVYADEKYLNQVLEDYNKEFNNNYSAIPIINYKKEIKGNGKLISLKQISNNWYYRNGGAGELQYIDEDGDPAGMMPIILLYLPEGRSLDEGLMMWK